MYCPQCGAYNNDGSEFCQSCGASFATQPQAEQQVQDTIVKEEQTSFQPQASYEQQNNQNQYQQQGYQQNSQYQQQSYNQGNQYQQPGYQQNNKYQQPNYYSGNPMPQKVDNYLVWSILVTVLCCIPAGIWAIIESKKVDELSNAGRYDEAVQQSQKVKKIVTITAIVMAIIEILYIVIAVIGGIGAASYY